MSAVATSHTRARRTRFVPTPVGDGVARTLFDAAAVEDGTPPAAFDGAGGEPGLDVAVVHLWEGLIAHRLVPCPVCGSDMRPQYGVHALPIGGQCDDCGSTLS